MKVEIQNGKLAAVINFLYELKLKRKDSRFRRHLITLLNERLITVEEDRTALMEEHSHKDSDGKVIIIDGQYDIKDLVAFSNDVKELNEELLVIEGGDNREMIRTVKSFLKKFEDVEYEGQNSDAYDYLCDQFHVDEDEANHVENAE